MEAVIFFILILIIVFCGFVLLAQLLLGIGTLAVSLHLDRLFEPCVTVFAKVSDVVMGDILRAADRLARKVFDE